MSFSVTNLRQVVAEVRAAGHQVPVDVTVFSPELGYAYVADPDGNWIELYGPTA
jgi:catechol 2,3-dioxygenase-like lactoylglutathione lyase family enzyme